MAFSSSFADALNLGYDAATPKQDKNNKTAYQRYIEKFYGPGVTSHRDPLAVARAATGAVAQGLKTGAGFLGHAAAGLLGAPMGPSGGRTAAGTTNTGGGIGSDVGAVSGITPTNRLYGGNPGTGAGISAYDPGSSRQGMDGVLDAISRAEGTTRNGYNEVLGYGAYGRPSKPITEMTLQEVHDYGRNTLFNGQRAQGIPEKKLSSATGRYQITGDNIKTYATRWGLDMKTTKWTPQLQDRIAIDLAKNTPKGLANWEGFKTKTGQKLKQQATTALAYAPTDATTSPAIQAATEQAQGRASSSSYERSPEIAQMQRDLNSRGAKLTVDGIRGPLTQAAEKQFLGSPTSVRTPSFTASPPTTPQATRANNWSSLQGSPTRTVNQRQDYVPSPSFTNRPVYNSGGQDEGRGLPRNPYTSSTGGANALQGVIGDYSGARRSVPPLAPLGSVPPPAPIVGRSPAAISDAYSDYEARRAAAMSGVPVTPRPVPTYSITPPMQWSQLQQPYLTSRIPQARPPQAPQARPVEEAAPTLIDRLGNLVERAERALGGNRGSDSRSSAGSHSSAGSRSGGSGNYSGGNYGGQGGSRISEGVGGAYRNR